MFPRALYSRGCTSATRAVPLRGGRDVIRKCMSSAAGGASTSEAPESARQQDTEADRPALDSVPEYSSEASTRLDPSSDSHGHLASTSSSASSSSSAPIADYVQETKDETRQQSIDNLWDRVLRTPAAVVGTTYVKPVWMPLERSTPTRRHLKGTRTPRRRSEGQTPHEARGLNDALARVYDQLAATAFQPRVDRQRNWDSLLRPPPAWKRGPRVEDDGPELTMAVDALAEELSLLNSSTEVVAWAQDKVFLRELAPNARAQYAKTYPRALAALIRTLWVRLNAPHLALAMFDHAKALGIESYLAGCQTSAYNELIRVKWEAFRDLSGVLEAIKEMEQHAVAWDRGTSEIVGAVVDAVGKEILQAKGRWGKEAYTQLAALERFLAKDTEREETMYDKQSKIKRAFRQGGENRRSRFGMEMEA